MAAWPGVDRDAYTRIPDPDALDGRVYCSSQMAKLT